MFAYGNVNHLYKSKFVPVMLIGIQNLIFALQKSIYIKARMVNKIHNAMYYYRLLLLVIYQPKLI